MRDTCSIVIFFMAGLFASAGAAGANATGSTAKTLRGSGTGDSEVVFLVVMASLPEPQLGAEVRLAALKELTQHKQDRAGLRRAARDVHVHLDHRLKRPCLLEQRGHAVRRHALTFRGALDVDTLEELGGGDAVAHRRHVARYRAVAQRNHDFAARPRRLRELEVVLTAD